MISEFPEKKYNAYLEEITMESIKKYGFDRDFFNELPSEWPCNDDCMDKFLSRCEAGKVKTYTQKFQDQFEILKKSNPEIVKKLDILIEKLISTTKNRSFDEARDIVQQILNFAPKI